jgi:Cu/Ag efflux pump CusA
MQAQVLVPLATSIIFGLLTTTLLVLLVVPALFSILHDLGIATTAKELATLESETT